jgi:hypothetical protein
MMIWKKNFEKKENALIGEMSLEGSWLKNKPLKLCHKFHGKGTGKTK